MLKHLLSPLPYSWRIMEWEATMSINCIPQLAASYIYIIRSFFQKDFVFFQVRLLFFFQDQKCTFRKSIFLLFPPPTQVCVLMKNDAESNNRWETVSGYWTCQGLQEINILGQLAQGQKQTFLPPPKKAKMLKNLKYFTKAQLYSALLFLPSIRYLLWSSDKLIAYGHDIHK